MASPAVAVPNGIPEPSHHDVDMADTPAHPTTMKRKRELSINGVAASQHSATTNGISHPTEDEKSAIRDYLMVLQRYVESLYSRMSSLCTVATSLRCHHVMIRLLILAHLQIRCEPFAPQTTSP
jgi:hypothetical protein